MKRMACGTAATLALVGLAACFSNPALDLNNGNFHIVQPTPLVAFTKVGDSLQVRLRLVNDNNNGTITSFVIAGVGSGISVRYDDKFRPYYTSGDTLVVPVDKDMQQYYVKGLAPGKWTFTASATANSGAPAATITINVEAKDLGAALSRTTGLAAGDTVNITAPAGLVFSQTSAVTFATGPSVIASRSADSTIIRVVVGPGVSGAATVTKVGMPANTLLGVATLSTTNLVTAVPNVTVAPTTVSSAAPLIGVPITVTLGGNLRFIASSHLFIGGIEAGIQSVSADSSTATVMPMMTSTGNITYTNVALSFLTSVPLALPGDKTVAVAATYGGASDPNAGTIATASTIVFPPVGRSFIFSDGGALTSSAPCTASGNGTDGCRFYKFVLTGAATYDAEFRWQGTADMGLYRVNSTGGGLSSQNTCDNGGQGLPAVETCTVTGLAAGTYFIMVTFFGTGAGYPPSAATVPPAFFQFRITSK